MYFARAVQRTGAVRRSFAAPFSTSTVRGSGSDYGSGEHNSLKNPSESKEHPGARAPDASKDGGKQQSSDSGSQPSKSEPPTNKASNGAKPKIHSENSPKEHEQSAEVKEHNKNFDNKKI